jgi:beta-xylosidase
MEMTRKELLRRIVAGCAATIFPLRVGFTREQVPPAAWSLSIPYPAKPWSQANRIVGDRPQLSLDRLKGKAPSFDRTPLYNDFCLAQSIDGRWHCIGILFEGKSRAEFRQNQLFHYVSDSIEGPYHSVGRLDLGYGKRDGVWAPCIVRDENRTLMYYAHVGKEGMSIRVARAEDNQLLRWHRGAGNEEVLVTEEGARDPEIIKDQRTGLFLMFYVCSVKTANDWEGVVRVRTSTDLLKWSEPRTVLGTPPGYGGPESVFVLQNNGIYYMWVSGAEDYGVMSLYISMDPFNFGDVVENRIEQQPGHAAEILRAKGKYWMACVAIASVSNLDTAKRHDLPITQHDLEGVWIQPLEWRSATAAMKSKVVHASHQV